MQLDNESTYTTLNPDTAQAVGARSTGESSSRLTVRGAPSPPFARNEALLVPYYEMLARQRSSRSEDQDPERLAHGRTRR